MFKKFIKDNKGVGIIEYVILLSLLGTVVVTTTPVLREQVGQMYEEQVNSTNHLNGMIDTQSADRFDLDTSTPFVRQPNGTVTNPGGSTDTELTPIILEKKNITYNFITTNSEEIADTYFYDDGQFDGVLFKTAAPTTQRVLATRNVQLEKEATKVIQGSEEELIAQDTIIETDSEGYTGTLIATGDIEKYITGTSPDSYIETKQITTASPMISSIETTNSNASQVALEFPTEKYFEETQVISGVESQTGYKGTLSKYSTPVRTQLANVNVTDVKPAVQNRTFGKTVEVTNSITDKTYKYVSGQGFTATNSTTYPTTYHYKDTVKEGLLNYVSKSSTLINTQVDTQNVSVSPQFSSSPGTTYNYNSGGYTGTLNSTNEPTIVSGYYSPADSKYVSGQSSSNYNDGTYSGTLSSYVSGQSWVASDSFYATDSRSQSGTCQTDPNCASSNLPSSVSYNSGGYSGTLSQTSYSYSQSQQAVPFSYSRYATYGGTVTKPGYWVNNYAYQGTVYKPVSDTRIWTRNYEGAVSKTTDTYEYFANYSGKIFDLVSRVPSAAPATISYTDATGYTGTLDKDIPSETNSLISLTTSTVTTNISGYKVYTPGVFTSNVNTQTYPATHNYNSGGYTGPLNYVSKSTEFAYSQQENHKSQTYKQTSTSSSIASTYNYNSGGFWGTLNAINATYVDSGTYTPSDTIYVTDQTASSYNSGGYSGILSSYVYSGTYTPSDTIYVTNQTSSYYNSGGYSGSLSSYLYSTYWTPADTIYVTAQTSSYYNSGGYSGSLSQYLYSGTYTPSDSRWEYTTKQGDNWQHYGCSSNKWTVTNSGETNIQGTTYTYNSGGYSGTYSVDSVDYKTSTAGTYRSSGTYCATNGATGYYKEYNTVYMSAYVTKPASDTRVYRYQGNVTKPGYDTNVYRYQGNVTKPAIDTRVYRYQGNVTKAAVDTRVYARDYDGIVSQTINYYNHFGTYSGTVSKPLYFANFNYVADYKGNISKTASVPNYRYDQKYIGTLEKANIAFEYGYERTYEGTIFKNVIEQDIEYTQEYAGEVTRK